MPDFVKVKKGYAPLATPISTTATTLASENKELESALFSNRDDERAWLVFGDWLSSRGDARGEAIALSFGDHRAELEALIATHETSWLGGRFDSVGVGKAGWSPPAVVIEWIHGFMHHAETGGPFASLNAEQLAQFLSAPAARFLHALTLRDFFKAASVVRAAHLPALRHLRVEGGRAVDFQEYLAALPNLIQFRGTARSATSLRHDRLQSLSLSLLWTSTYLESARLPKLERLRVIEYGELNLESYASMLAGKSLQSLKHLRLSTRQADAFIPRLATSVLLPRLETLDLSGSVITSRGARDLLAHREAFVHLQRLDLRETCHSDVIRELATEMKIEGKLLVGGEPFDGTVFGG